MPELRRIQVSIYQDVAVSIGVSRLLLKYEVNHHLLEFVRFLSVYYTKMVKNMETFQRR